MVSNEQILIDYIQEQKAKALSPTWVIWALKYLERANQSGWSVNPDYLRAEVKFTNDNEPQMSVCQPI